jgi:hypothetical protein
VSVIATAGKFLDNDLDAELGLLHVYNGTRLILAHLFGGLMRAPRPGRDDLCLLDGRRGGRSLVEQLRRIESP